MNSLVLWPEDMNIAKSLGLNAYRFSIEWARIESEPGLFSAAMLDHYKAMIDVSRARGLAPIVTFNHFVSPCWFAAQGGRLNSKTPELFVRFCGKAARHLAEGIDHAITFNEPNIVRLLRVNGLPPLILDKQRGMLLAAAKATNRENSSPDTSPISAYSALTVVTSNAQRSRARKFIRPS